MATTTTMGTSSPSTTRRSNAIGYWIAAGVLLLAVIVYSMVASRDAGRVNNNMGVPAIQESTQPRDTNYDGTATGGSQQNTTEQAPTNP